MQRLHARGLVRELEPVPELEDEQEMKGRLSEGRAVDRRKTGAANLRSTPDLVGSFLGIQRMFYESGKNDIKSARQLSPSKRNLAHLSLK